MGHWTMSFVVSLLIVLFASALPVHAEETALTLNSDLLTGTWNVVCKPTPINTCGGTAKTTVVQWLLAAQEDQTISVTVLGKADVASMAGTYAGKQVFVNGEGQRLSEKGTGMFGFGEETMELYGSMAVVFQMGAESQFNGTAYVPSARRQGKKAVTCFTELSCAGTKL